MPKVTSAMKEYFATHLKGKKKRHGRYRNWKKVFVGNSLERIV